MRVRKKIMLHETLDASVVLCAHKPKRPCQFVIFLQIMHVTSIINLGNPNGPMRIPNSGQCFPGKLDYNAAQSVFVKQDVDKNGNLNFGGKWYFCCMSRLPFSSQHAL